MDSRILQLASKDFYNLLVYCSIFSEEIGLANSWKSLVVRHEIVAFILLVSRYIETSQLICFENQCSGF